MLTRVRPLEWAITAIYHFLVEEGFFVEPYECVQRWCPEGTVPTLSKRLCLLRDLRMLLHEHFPAEVAARFDR